MNTYVSRTAKHAATGHANGTIQKKGAPDLHSQFVDNRPESITQRKYREAASGCSQARQIAQFQAMSDRHSSQQPHPIQQRENKTGLPDDLKNGIENLSGLAMDDVKVHFNSHKPAQLQAFAYAQGTDIHVAPGQEKHLPHEAWHVVQQKQGRVRPTMQMKGGIKVNNDGKLEKEADEMGAQALHHLPIQAKAAQCNSIRPIHAGAAVAQLATNLRFDNKVTGKSEITATQHNRSGVHLTALNWVFDHGAWKQVPGNSVCNHSRDYNNIAQTILDAIHDEELTDAADTVNDIYESLQGNGMGIGTPTSSHKNRMDDVIANPGNVVNVDNIIDTFNYYIYKICDYPRNLFFWPNRTGGTADEPVGAHKPGGDWEANNKIISNKTRLNREKKRLADARDDINTALP
ncbi:eCIS core domain-containing protein [Parapedobacter pyrenivorans]|uniref:eCIS core domain-containing protein n=1 Tax=Parapedobacter pyrenivorans TaxID=1305674 RepID=UPI00333E90C3